MRRSRIKSPFINRKLPILVFLLLFLSLFFWRVFSYLPIQTDGYLKVRSTLLEEPKEYGKWQYFSLDVYRVKANSEHELNYGDILLIEGEVTKSRFTDPKIRVAGTSTWRKILFNIREGLREKIFEYFSEPQASLLAGITLGSKEDLPESFKDSLIQTGTIHVVVVSGYNISVVAGFLVGLSKFIKRQYATIFALLVIVFYTLLVGAEPPAVRAAIMGSVAFAAITLGRQRLPLYSLILAALLMTVISPIVVTEVGFQLSFLATAGIILFQKQLLNFLSFLPKPFSEDLSTTLAAQSLVVPVIFYHFGSVSAISPVANATTLWTIPIATVLGFLFIAASFTLPFFAQILSWVVWSFLFIFTSLVEVFSKLPITSFEFEPKQILPISVYYGVLVLAVYYFKYVRKAKAKQSKS